jgi:hypothetical protein
MLEAENSTGGVSKATVVVPVQNGAGTDTITILVVENARDSDVLMKKHQLRIKGRKGVAQTWTTVDYQHPQPSGGGGGGGGPSFNTIWNLVTLADAAYACGEGARLGFAVGGAYGAVGGCLAVGGAFYIGGEQARHRVEHALHP